MKSTSAPLTRLIALEIARTARLAVRFEANAFRAARAIRASALIIVRSQVHRRGGQMGGVDVDNPRAQAGTRPTPKTSSRDG